MTYQNQNDTKINGTGFPSGGPQREGDIQDPKEKQKTDGSKEDGGYNIPDQKGGDIPRDDNMYSQGENNPSEASGE